MKPALNTRPLAPRYRFSYRKTVVDSGPWTETVNRCRLVSSPRVARKYTGIYTEPSATGGEIGGGGWGWAHLKKHAARYRESWILAEVKAWSFAFSVSTGRHRNARIIHWRREEADIRWRLGLVQPLSLSLLSSERRSEAGTRIWGAPRTRIDLWPIACEEELQPVLETYTVAIVYSSMHWLCSWGQHTTHLSWQTP